MKNIMITTCMLLSFFYSNANEWSLSQAPYGRHIHGVQVIDDNTIIIVGGNERNDSITSLYISNDKGVNWSIIIDKPLFPWLQDVSFGTSSVGYACGYEGRLFKTTDSGQTWDSLALTGNARFRDYNTAFFIDDLTGYIAGGNRSNDSIQTILKTTDGGITWAIQRDNLGPWIKSLSFVDNNTGYAVGNKGTILKTTDGGANWNQVSVSNNIANRDLNDVYFKDANYGIIVGGNEANDSIQTIILTTDGGANWSIVEDKVASWLHGIDVPSETKAYVVGDDGTLLFSTDEGASWVNVNLPDSVNNNYHLYCIDFYSQDFGVAAGQHGKVLIYQADLPTVPTVHTGFTSIVSETEVALNATVNAEGSFAAVSFEYGSTINLGTTVSANLDSVFGTNTQDINAYLSGLSSGIYYYRVKANNRGGSSLGDVKQFYVGPDLFPNFDFELWKSDTIEKLKDWKAPGSTAYQKIQSYDGSYAVELRSSIDDSTSAVIWGDADDNGFSGGIPVNYRPDSIKGYFKYDLQAGYPALIMVDLRKNGNSIGQNAFHISGSSSNNFEKWSFPLSYSSPDTPDSIVVAVANNDPFNGTEHIDNVIAVDNIAFVSNNIAIPNGDFESWENEIKEYPLSWFTSDTENRDEDHIVTIFKTEDSQHGDYAIKMQNSGTDKNVRISTFSDQYGPTFPVAGRHATLNAYFKLDRDAQDTFSVNLVLFKNGQELAWANMIVDSSVIGYTGFSIPINYQNQTDTPDSAYLSLQLGVNDTNITNGNSVLYLDNISFDGFKEPYTPDTVSVETFSFLEEDSWLVYPNPASSLVNIKLKQNSQNVLITLFDIKGEQILPTYRIDNEEHIQFDLTNLKSGVYIISKIENGKLSTKKLVLTY